MCWTLVCVLYSNVYIVYSILKYNVLHGFNTGYNISIYKGLEEARPRAATGMPTGMRNACNVRHAYGLPGARHTGCNMYCEARGTHAYGLRQARLRAANRQRI